MGSTLQFTTHLLTPPGSSLARPTPSNPSPSCNHPLFNEAMYLRTKVFVEEQGCSAENEFDEDDARSWHWVLYATTSERRGKEEVPAGVIRLVPPPHADHDSSKIEAGNVEPKHAYVKLGRIAVIPEFRGLGFGRVLVDTALDYAAYHAREIVAGVDGEDVWSGLVLVHAQVRVEKVYESMGFVTDKSMGVWDEEGIDHIGMWKTVEVHVQTTTS